MTEQFTLKNAQRLPGSKVVLSPLALLILAACGGGGGGGVTTAPTSTGQSTFRLSGSVVKGPLENALAFLDYEGGTMGVRDADEPMVRTDENGNYVLTGTVGKTVASVIAMTDEATVDTSSGTVLSGVTLKAPKPDSASSETAVLSIASTMMVDQNLSETQVQEVLGIAGDVDLLTFNPFAETTDAATLAIAAAVESKSQQIGAVITSMAAAAESSGMDSSLAFASALTAVATVVKEKAETVGGAVAIDLTQSADIAAVSTKVEAAVTADFNEKVAASGKTAEAYKAEQKAAGTAYDPDAFTNLKASVETAVQNVNKKINDTVDATNFKSDATKSIYSVTQVLAEQVKTAVASEVSDAGSGATSITLTDAAAVTTAAANAAPTDIDLKVDGVALDEGAALSVSEGIGSLAIATLDATDDSTAGADMVYSISGDDRYQKDADGEFVKDGSGNKIENFKIENGVLSFTSQPDYETKSSYNISINAKDAGGKTFSEAFVINITDVNEAEFASKFQVTTSTTSDATFTDFIQGSVKTLASEQVLDLTVSDGVASIGTLNVDINNLKAVMNEGATTAPTISVTLAKLADVSSGTVTKTIEMTVVDGADAARDVDTERSFVLKFDVDIKDVGGNLTISAAKDAEGKVIPGAVTYYGTKDEDGVALINVDVANGKALSIGSDNNLNVNLFSLIEAAKAKLDTIGESADFVKAGTFHATLSGLPMIDDNGGEISSMTAKVVIEDRDHTPIVTIDADPAMATDGGAAVTGDFNADDAEGQKVTFGIDGAGAATELVGKYGTFKFTNLNGAYSYTLSKDLVKGLKADETATDSFTITGTDTQGNVGTTKVDFTVKGINDAPVDVKISPTKPDANEKPTLDENEAGGIVGTLSATDPEGLPLKYKLVSTGDYELFDVTPVNGIWTLKLKDAVATDYEALKGKNYKYSVSVIATDKSDVDSAAKAFEVTVNDKNDAPAFAKPASRSVIEGSGKDVKGAFTPTDQDDGAVITYVFQDTQDRTYSPSGGSTFTAGDTSVTLHGTYGDLTITLSPSNVAGSYTYVLNETKADSLKVGASATDTFAIAVKDDAGVQTAFQNFQVKITGTNDVPENIALTGGSTLGTVAENAAGAIVGTLSATDKESEKVDFDLAKGGDNEYFEITAGNRLKLKDSVAADYDAKSSYTLTVEASDASLGVSQQTITVNVSNETQEENQFWVSTKDAASDAILTDYINGTETATTAIDLTKDGVGDVDAGIGVLKFPTVYVDANNLKLGTQNSSSFQSPSLVFNLDQVPVIKDLSGALSTETRTITLTVTEGTDGSRVSGERKVVVTFNVELSGDGTNASLKTVENGDATILYYGNNATEAATLTINNGDVDTVSLKAGENGLPPTLTVKAIELLSKVSALNPAAILGEGAKLHVKLEGLPLADDTGAVSFSAVEGLVEVKDLIKPTSTITGASYDSDTGQIIIQGTKFDDLDVAIGGEIKDYLDWSQLTWQTGAAASANDVTFTLSDISTAKITSADTITVTLAAGTGVGKDKLESATDYGTSGGADKLVVTKDFIRDKALNSTKEDSSGSVTVINLSELIRVSTDSSADVTLTDYLDSTTAAITQLDATVSEGVLSFGSAQLDLVNIQKAVAADNSAYKSPELSITVDKLAKVASDTTLPVKITIIDGGDGDQSSTERKVEVTFDLILSGNDGTTSTFKANTDGATVAYFSAGEKVSAKGTVDVPNAEADLISVSTGTNGLPSAIKIKSLALIEKINEISPSTVLADGGTYFVSVSGLPIADENGPIDRVEGALTIKDLVPPESTIVSAKYNETSGVISLVGDKFDDIGVGDGKSVIDYLDFKQLAWDIQGDNSAKKTFTKDDFSSAIKKDTNTIELTLKTDAKNALEGTTGFAFAGLNGEYSATLDTIDVQAGFIADAAGNKSITDAKADAAIDYSDDAKPELVSFTSGSNDGPYGKDLKVVINANFNDDVLKGSTMTVKFNTADNSSGTPVYDTLELKAEQTGSVLTAEYVVAAGRTTPAEGLNITEIVSISVYDVYGNQQTSKSIPTGKSLKDMSDITVDTNPPAASIDSVEYDASAGIIKISGSGFSEIGATSTTDDVKEYLNWGNLVWDINSDDGSDNYTILKDHVATAYVSSNTLLEVTLKSDWKSYLESQPGFGAEGVADTIDVTKGFIRDKALNPSADDAKAGAAISYKNVSTPKIDSFTTDLGTAAGSGSTAYGTKLADGTTTTVIKVTANMSEKVTSGSKTEVTLNVVGGATGSNKVELTADADGMTMSGNYTVVSNNTTSGADLKVDTYTKGTVTSIFGQTLAGTSMTGVTNIDASKSLTIDTNPADASISAVVYDPNSGTLTFTGSGFDTMNVSKGDSIKSYLDFSKMTWNFDASDTGNTHADISFNDVDADVKSATYEGSKTLKVVLSDAKKTEIESSAGFAAKGVADKVADALNTGNGFIRDHAYNPDTDDASQSTLSYENVGSLEIVKFFTDMAANDYGYPNTITIKVEMTEVVLPGTELKVQLNSGTGAGHQATFDTVDDTVTGEKAGKIMIAKWDIPNPSDSTIPSASAPNGLNISSVVSSDVTDLYGNSLDTTFTSGENLLATTKLVVDTQAPTATVDTVTLTDAGVLTLEGSGFDTLDVGNTTVLDQLAWTTGSSSNLVWNIQGDTTTSNDYNFVKSDFASAVVTNKDTLTLTLSDTGKANLLSTTGFGFAGLDGKYTASDADKLEVKSGLFVDKGGNVSTYSVGVAPSYTSTAPEVDEFTSTNGTGTFGKDQTLNITAVMSDDVLAGSVFTVELNANKGTFYEMKRSDTEANKLEANISIPSGFATEELKVLQFTQGTVYDIYGKQMTSVTLPAKNMSGQVIKIDTKAPDSVVASVTYDSEAGKITLTGSKFDELGVAEGKPAASNVNLKKMVWDVDAGHAGSTIPDIEIQSGWVDKVIYKDAETIEITLTADGKKNLEGSEGFAAKGESGSSTDNVNFQAGFFIDAAGNIGEKTTDDAVITYTDQTAPTVKSFSVDKDTGQYGKGEKITITATMDEVVLKGSSFVVQLNNSTNITLTAAETGDKLTFEWTIPSGFAATALNVTKITLGTTTDLYGKVMSSTTLPNGQNIADSKTIEIDTLAPTSVVDSVTYDPGTKELVIVGDKFNEINVDNTSSILSYLDFNQLSWDFNGDDATTTPFSLFGKVESAILTNKNTITLTLTDDAASALAADPAFGARGGTDTVDVSAGFISDKFGNTATLDVKADAAITYADEGRPYVTKFYVDADASKAYKKDDEVLIKAEMNETVLTGAVINVKFGTGGTAKLVASADGKILSGKYTVGANETSADLNVTSYTLGLASASENVQDIYGNQANSTTLPAGQNLANTSDVVIDTTAPTLVTISSAKYNGSGGTSGTDAVITITGTNFDTLGVDNGGSVMKYLNWEKMDWNIDKSGIENDPKTHVDFALGDIKSAVVTSDTTLTITLEDSKKTSLETTSGFAGSTADDLKISNGFIRDHALNEATKDGTSATISYSDVTGPKIKKIYSDASDSYKALQSVEIKAEMTENVQAGAEIILTLGTTDTVTLKVGETAGKILTGNYIVSAGDNSADLTVSSVALSTDATKAVKDMVGNSMTDTGIPEGQNLSNNADIVIDTVPLFANGKATLSDATAMDAGDTITLKFTEAVGNTGTIADTFTADDATKYGSEGAASAVWSDGNKTLTITLGAGETFTTGEQITIADIIDVAGNNTTLTIDTV